MTPSLSRAAWAAALLVPAAADRAAEPFDYFQNSWNVIGLKDYRDGTRVTPENQLVLSGNRRVRIRFGRALTPLSREQTKTLMDGWLPVILLTARDGPVRYEFTIWATPLPWVKDWKSAFDGPGEGENFLNWIRVKVTNEGPTPCAARVRCELLGSDRPVGEPLARTLEPGTHAEHVVRIPFAPLEHERSVDTQDADLWLGRTREYWHGLMAAAARIEVPCEKATHALRAAHVCQLIAADHGELHGGEGFYDEFYIRDGGYQIQELEEAGLWNEVRNALKSYLAAQRDDGRFETQKGQLDANGQAVWVLWQYYRISGDREWLAQVYPRMRRAVEWTMKARRQEPADSPFAGLLPPAVADGEFLWDGKHRIVGYDLWNLRGMLCTADAARALGRHDEAARLEEEAAMYRAAIDAACRRTGRDHLAPSWEGAGTHWGNTETLWPTELFAADDPRVAATLHHARAIHGGGFVEGTIRWLGAADAIHPYMSTYTTMTTLARGDDRQVVEDFYWYLLHSSASHAFAEGIFYKRRFAWGDTIPHVTGASNYALLLRHMLVHEQGEDLHLLAAVPDGWLADGNEIRVDRAPTHFGVLSLHVRGRTDGVEIRFDPPARHKPRRVVLHLPESRPGRAIPPGIEVVPRADQPIRWDFPTVVRTYEKTAPPLTGRTPGLIHLPLECPLGPDDCRMIDLSALTNTDPFTAPFGVVPAGKFVLAGMPVGVTTVGGVPFRIIDPAHNEGRGLIVLHSDKAPADRTWPREVEIPVAARGSALFLLGNVHGWAPSDAGTGPTGAVAEYVIHYADGSTQTVPLVTGRTIEEWTSPPTASEVWCGLRGDPWHLNVLGVALRPVEVTKLVFRDLGTPAAPVLVAVTLAR